MRLLGGLLVVADYGYRCVLTNPQIELMAADLPHVLYRTPDKGGIRPDDPSIRLNEQSLRRREERLRRRAEQQARQQEGAETDPKTGRRATGVGASAHTPTAPTVGRCAGGCDPRWAAVADDDTSEVEYEPQELWMEELLRSPLLTGAVEGQSRQGAQNTQKVWQDQ